MKSAPFKIKQRREDDHYECVITPLNDWQQACIGYGHTQEEADSNSLLEFTSWLKRFIKRFSTN